MNLYESLQAYSASDLYPMHMPGHKRNSAFQMTDPYQIDVTEVEGTDNLHHPQGVIRRLMDQMKDIYGTEETYLLVNGSTCGILAAVSACAQRGDTVIMDRNCHRSVYHAVYLLELKPVYLYPDSEPETGITLGIRVEEVAEAIRRYPAAACVIVTSPTYEGVVSDIRGIACQTRQRGIPLVVDEAHGAHFSWGHPVWKQIPESAIDQGADLVIESLHKTLPALTQTGVLHRCSDQVKAEVIERYLAIYESSSPSYILMSSVAQCMDWLSAHRKEAFVSYRENWREFRRQAGSWQRLSLWEYPEKDPARLVIRSGPLTGQELSERLRQKYQIQMELEAAGYVLAITSICDTERGWQRLAEALSQTDKELTAVGNNAGDTVEKAEWRLPGQVRSVSRCSLYEALNGPYEQVCLADSLGRTAAEYAFVYPPGIPFLVPGEEITAEVLGWLRYAREKKLNVMGMEDGTGARVRVCAKR